METLVRIVLCLVCGVSIVFFYLLAGLGIISLGFEWYESIILIIILMIIIAFSLVAFMKGLR